VAKCPKITSKIQNPKLRAATTNSPEAAAKRVGGNEGQPAPRLTQTAPATAPNLPPATPPAATAASGAGKGPLIPKANELQREEKLKLLRSQEQECDTKIREINERRANSRNLNIHRRKSIMYNADLEERSLLAWKDQLEQQIGH